MDITLITRSFLLGGALCSLAGCAVVKSESFQPVDEPGAARSNIAVAPKDQAGVVYFLPKKRLKLVGEIKFESTPAESKAKQELDKARSALKEANTDAKAKASKHKAATAAVKKAEADNAPPNTISRLKDEEYKARVESEKAATAEAKAQTEVDTKTRAYISALGSKDEVKVRKAALKIEALPPEPDPNGAYYSRIWHNWFRDDKFKITINDKGLLSSSHIEAADQTDEILVELAGLAGIIAGGPSNVATLTEDMKLNSLRGSTLLSRCPTDDAFKFEYIFDPIEWIIVDKQPGIATSYVNASAIREINYHKSMLAACFGRVVTIDRLGREGGSPDPAIVADTDDYDDGNASPNRGAVGTSRPYGAAYPRRDEYPGFAYRPQLPYRVSIAQVVGDPDSALGYDVSKLFSTGLAADGVEIVPERYLSDAETKAIEDQIKIEIADISKSPSTLPGALIVEQSSIVMLPNEAPTAFIPIKSAAFVKTINDVTFENGLIKSWDTDRPSEALEAVRLPVRMIKAFISIPADILQLKIDLSTKDKSLAEMQAAQIKANEALIKLQTCISQVEKLNNDALPDNDEDPMTCFKDGE